MTASIPTRAEYLAGWARLHGGYDIDRPSLVRFWLSVVYAVARPLAILRIPPDAITIAGGVLTAVAAWLAGQGDSGPLIASALILLTGVADNLDGAVAVLTDRASRWGFVLDSAVDRVADALYGVALVVVGAAIAPAAVAVLLTFEMEYVRARAGNAGMAELGVVTIAEKPTRVLITALFLLGAGLHPASASSWANAGAITWAVVGGIGLLQLLVVVHRRLR